MKTSGMSRWLGLIALVGLMGCDRAPPTPATAVPAVTMQTDGAWDELDDARFIGRIWVTLSPRNARGAIKVFMPDRTLLMYSCGGTLRVSRWAGRGNLIRWIEDTIPIEATVTLPRADELELQLTGMRQVHTLIAADETYACP